MENYLFGYTGIRGSLMIGMIGKKCENIVKNV